MLLRSSVDEIKPNQTSGSALPSVEDSSPTGALQVVRHTGTVIQHCTSKDGMDNYEIVITAFLVGKVVSQSRIRLYRRGGLLRDCLRRYGLQIGSAFVIFVDSNIPMCREGAPRS